jgi:squalene-hopene/tetraprenyl-beta-curcumene cyclase
MTDLEQLDAAISAATDKLLEMRDPRGHWVGRLSSSALSTATAIGALARVDADAHAGPIRRGLEWLAAEANDDGGWGDCPQSPSNIATTLLVWSAMALTGGQQRHPETHRAAEAWLGDRAGSLEPAALIEAVGQRYGSDQTFAAPILAMCALAGRLGPAGWSRVPQLPFEAALLPHRLLKWLQLPVVSYALPALIAIGQVRHHHAASRCPVKRFLRNRARSRTLGKLARIQPESGGFLEAAPLTAFVTMSLAGMDLADHPVARRGTAFLLDTARADGSWPIDTDLATWVTTHAVTSLAAAGCLDRELAPADQAEIRNWLLAQQHLRTHVYTQADPGGWAWTHRSGGVPDADDTPSALLALDRLGPVDAQLRRRARKAVVWLLSIRNRDYGIPTFCRGWGRLPFDRSTCDLTAHTMRAWARWKPRMPSRLAGALDLQIRLAGGFLQKHRRPDGAWVPLWFGNQWADGQTNAVFGTGRVVLALAEVIESGYPDFAEMLADGAGFLLVSQGESGGWGGEPGVQPSVEETAVAVEALAAAGAVLEDPDLRRSVRRAVGRGCDWLLGATEGGHRFPAAPIGLYFASLWYSEQAYPLVFALGAWGRGRNLLAAADVTSTA